MMTGCNTQASATLCQAQLRLTSMQTASAEALVAFLSTSSRRKRISLCFATTSPNVCRNHTNLSAIFSSATHSWRKRTCLFGIEPVYQVRTRTGTPADQSRLPMSLRVGDVQLCTQDRPSRDWTRPGWKSIALQLTPSCARKVCNVHA